MKNLVKLTGIFICSAALMAGSCEKQLETEGYRPEAIQLDRESLTMKVGEQVQLTARPNPSVAHELTFQWTSSDQAVVTVNSGLVTAEGPGEAEVSASYGDVSASMKVFVNDPDDGDRALLYSLRPGGMSPEQIPELLIGTAGRLTDDGLEVSAPGEIIKLDRFYALAERVVEYTVSFSDDTEAVFQSSQGDFKAFVSVPGRKISINTTPAIEADAPFLRGGRDYRLEIYHIYNKARVVITDLASGESAELSAVHDGQGGCGQGALQPGFNVGMQWDHYCFGLVSGAPFTIKDIEVHALKKSVRLLMYGASISQPEGYFPAATFHESWTQRVISALGGNAMSSGRGGCTINDVLVYIKNELPFVDAEYVMVTIGTNGGNTEENLTELMNYIISQGSTPILNNIPCNESGTQVETNAVIAAVRGKMGLNGCLFDLATSEDGDGKTVDKSMMFWEDYSGSYGWQIWHHPNSKGGEAMFLRTQTDTPEIYE